MSKALAVDTAARFALLTNRKPAIVPDSGRAFVLDVFSREWHVFFQEEPDPYMALVTGSFHPVYRRVAVHSETGACRWVEDEELPAR